MLIVLGIIGLIADMTIPTLINSYQKQVTVIKLQKAFSTIEQAVRLSEAENGSVINWDFGTGYTKADVKRVLDAYFVPYLRSASKTSLHDDETASGYNSNKMVLSDGTVLIFSLDGNSAEGRAPTSFYIDADINGDKKPNILGKDRFRISVRKITNPVSFFCWKGPAATQCYPNASREDIINGSLYGCRKGVQTMLNCGALIQYDGWKISDDYPW